MKTKFETVQDVLDFMADVPEGLEAHYQGLLGPRSRGSSSAIGLEDMADVELTDISDEVEKVGFAQKNCIYLRGEHKDLGGRVQAMPLRKLMKVHEDICNQGAGTKDSYHYLERHRPMVELRDAGKHGVDHVYVLHPDWEDEFMPLTDEFMIVIGLHVTPGKVEQAVFTWHPGPIMSNGSKEFTMDSVIKLEMKHG